MSFSLWIAKYKVLNILEAEFRFTLGDGIFRFFIFLSTMRLPKYSWILKQMLLFLGLLASFAHFSHSKTMAGLSLLERFCPQNMLAKFNSIHYIDPKTW